jgi:hypothetical protein
MMCFSAAKPEPDAALEAERAKRAAELEAEKKAQADREEEDRVQTARGMRGQKSLLSGENLGIGFTLGVKG